MTTLAVRRPRQQPTLSSTRFVERGENGVLFSHLPFFLQLPSGAVPMKQMAPPPMVQQQQHYYDPMQAQQAHFYDARQMMHQQPHYYDPMQQEQQQQPQAFFNDQVAATPVEERVRIDAIAPLVLAIIACFGIWPCGIISLVWSHKNMKKINYSREHHKFRMVRIAQIVAAVALIFTIIYVIFFICFAVFYFQEVYSIMCSQGDPGYCEAAGKYLSKWIK
jgi:hypothetical protein